MRKIPMIDSRHPLILFDTYDDGYCEEKGWVEATVDENEARDILAEYCFDEDGKEGFRPVGSAKKVYMRPEDEYAERWVICPATEKDDSIIKCWEIHVY
jgi:hypothetical protein